MFKNCKNALRSRAKEVHVRIASPKIKFPDFYGVDMPTKELLANQKSNEEICEYIKAKSVFLSLDGLYEALEKGKEITHILNLATTISQGSILLNQKIIWERLK